VVAEVDDRLRADRDVDQLRRSIQGHWIRGTILVDITVEDRDPDTAATIANTVADVLVDGEVTGEVAGPTLDDLVLTTSDTAEPPATFSRPDRALPSPSGCSSPSGWPPWQRCCATGVRTRSRTPPEWRRRRPPRCWLTWRRPAT